MAAVDVYNGMLLTAGTSVLPDGLDYAYVVHPDYPAGKPLVAKGYNFRTVRKGGNNPTPNGPLGTSKRNCCQLRCLLVGTRIPRL